MSQDVSHSTPPEGTGPADAAPPTLDADTVEALGRHLGQAVEAAGRALAAYLRPREAGRGPGPMLETWQAAIAAVTVLGAYWANEPQRLAALQTDLLQEVALAFQPAGGGQPQDASATLLRLHGAASRWAEALVREAELEPATRRRAAFALRQVAAALAPSTLPFADPALLRQTLDERGANLARGLSQLADDIAAGGGELRLRQSDPGRFRPGIEVAATPGQVVLRTELMELIQYAPATTAVLARPVLVCPPWINKYYVLDLGPEKSFVGWCVAQGLTVFMISWVNPDARHRALGWDDYMRLGPLAALDAIGRLTGERQVSTLGYCVGGTLLAAALAVQAARGDDRAASLTLLTAQLDFADAGDLAVFVDEAQVAAVEREMAREGTWPGTRMAWVFNLLRPESLVWPFVTRAYLQGRQPPAFDVLAWNGDTTRLTEANHGFYLRQCYLWNHLSQGRMVLDGQSVDLSRLALPTYCLATAEDHISPAASVYAGCAALGGPVRFILAGSGHIAGVVNPPAWNKYGYRTGTATGDPFEAWREGAEAHDGSWWPDWLAWLEALAPERMPAAARQPAEAGLGPAPGTYVLVRE